jgi:hypothetical protein
MLHKDLNANDLLSSALDRRTPVMNEVEALLTVIEVNSGAVVSDIVSDAFLLTKTAEEYATLFVPAYNRALRVSGDFSSPCYEETKRALDRLNEKIVKRIYASVREDKRFSEVVEAMPKLTSKGARRKKRTVKKGS